jgi:hypothetical protein
VIDQRRGLLTGREGAKVSQRVMAHGFGAAAFVITNRTGFDVGAPNPLRVTSAASAASAALRLVSGWPQ